VTTTSAQVVERTAPLPSRRDRFLLVLRRFSAVSVAGALAGLVVGGIGGRLAMLLLARLNPEAHGLVSDDGFVMGQLDPLATLNLLAAGTGLGLFGAAVYVVLRGLRTGPPWFQLLSLSVGPAVVVGEVLVHTDGVDFRVLDPVELAIGLFVLLPGVYVLVLVLLSDRWLRPDSWWSRARPAAVAGTFLVWVLLFPLLPVLVALALLWLVQDAVRQTTTGRRLLGWAGWPWAARAALALLFLRSGAVLLDEIAVLT
jgi:hypothetical protein